MFGIILFAYVKNTQTSKKLTPLDRTNCDTHSLRMDIHWNRFANQKDIDF
jgi:hypothetical protein